LSGWASYDSVWSFLYSTYYGEKQYHSVCVLAVRYRFSSAVTEVSLSFYSAVYAANESTVFLGFIVLLIAAVEHFERVCQEFSACSQHTFIVILCHSV
jgi:hypothetical protein